MSAEIVHARVDYRLIHGQIVTKWLKQCGANRIIIIDDYLSTDPFLGQVYKMAAPTGVQVDIVSVNQAKNLWLPNKMVKGKILLLFKSIEMASNTLSAGLKLERLQIGGYEKKENSLNVHHGIYLNYDEAKILENISRKNTKVYFQTIPGEESESIEDVLKKFNK